MLQVSLWTAGAAAVRDILLDSMLRMEMRMMQKVRINQNQSASTSINQHINQQSISGTGWVGLEISAHIKERLNSVRPWLGGSVINKILLHYWKEGKTTVSRRVQRPLAKSLLGSSGR